MNAMDLLGTIMNSGMSRSGGHRIEHSMGSSGVGTPGGIRGQVLGSAGVATQSLELDDATRLTAGLRKPANAHEEQQLMDVASLTVKAMINAAKADGEIDGTEKDRIVGKLEEGVSATKSGAICRIWPPR